MWDGPPYGLVQFRFARNREERKRPGQLTPRPAAASPALYTDRPPLPRARLVLAAGALAQVPFVRTLLVVGGSTPTANGTALQVALSNITTNSATNPWLIKVEPGIFDVG